MDECLCQDQQGADGQTFPGNTLRSHSLPSARHVLLFTCNRCLLRPVSGHIRSLGAGSLMTLMEFLLPSELFCYAVSLTKPACVLLPGPTLARQTMGLTRPRHRHRFLVFEHTAITKNITSTVIKCETLWYSRYPQKQQQNLTALFLGESVKCHHAKYI